MKERWFRCEILIAALLLAQAWLLRELWKYARAMESAAYIATRDSSALNSWMLQRNWCADILRNELLLAVVLVPAYLAVRIYISWRATKAPVIAGREPGAWWKPLFYQLSLVIFLVWNSPVYFEILWFQGLIPGSRTPQNRVGATAGDIGAFNSALALYQVDVQCKKFPATTLTQLYSDNAAGWSGPYMATITNDPWNNEYIYTSAGTTYTIQSIHESDYNKSETIRYCFGTGVMESSP